jgi:hypothetical protein
MPTRAKSGLWCMFQNMLLLEPTGANRVKNTENKNEQSDFISTRGNKVTRTKDRKAKITHPSDSEA